MKSSKKRISHDNVNYLPSFIGDSFLEELVHLVDELAPRGPKEAYLKSEFLSKFVGEETASADDRRAAAIHKWMTVEATNRVTNLRLEFDDDFGWSNSDLIFEKAAKIIQTVLGPLEEASLFKQGSHSNGASTRVKRSPKAALLKHIGEAHITSSALKYWYTFASCTQLSSQPLSLQESSVLFTVPKASDIDRVACKEPEINMFLQRIVGKKIRDKLLKFGINLKDQRINQGLARTARKRRLATIDLSSASDSISQTLVRRLLPREWWIVLDDLRAHSVNVDGEIHDLKMFSSMGNGFTFELETLIFWALTRAVCQLSGVKGRISVYGDDIICPSAIGPRLARVFSWFGFKVNTKKSNWSGPFRESCGKHYHNSLDVTPFYVRGPIRQKSDVIRLLNRLLQWDSCGFQCLTTPEVIRFHRKWAQHVPRVLHGGQDPNSDSSLVTGDLPRKRLLRKIRPLEFDQQAGLLFWLTVKETTMLPLSCDPGTDGKFFLSDQPSWLVQGTLCLLDIPIGQTPSGVRYTRQWCTRWDPYMIEDHSLSAT